MKKVSTLTYSQRNNLIKSNPKDKVLKIWRMLSIKINHRPKIKKYKRRKSQQLKKMKSKKKSENSPLPEIDDEEIQEYDKPKQSKETDIKAGVRPNAKHNSNGSNGNPP